MTEQNTGLTYPHEHIKTINTNIEQLSLKLTWELAEQSFYNKSYKEKNNTDFAQEAVRSGNAPLAGDKKEETYHNLGDLT